MRIKNEEVLKNTVQRAKEKNIIIPTYEEMREPDKIPQKIKDELTNVGLWDIHPRNLFRITWKNEPKKFGGLFNSINFIEFPKELTGVKSRIIMMIGKWSPTGSHKVGATFGPLVSKLITGEFDPTKHKALWPSTGNYCRGGVYDSNLLGCKSIAVLPEGMSKERFDWLKSMGAEIYATPGSESNVKEVFDKSEELKRQNPDEVFILNQFEDFGNPTWHYAVTGPAMEEIFNKVKRKGDKLSGLFLTQGSAGTLGSGNYLKEKFPNLKVAAGEALQCPTLLLNGYGAHRIEGIGNKHVPWIMDVKNLDIVVDIDDEDCFRLLRLFNEENGKKFLHSLKISEDFINNLELIGISGFANLIGSIKISKYFNFKENDIIITVATDSMELYKSRVVELQEERGAYSLIQAGRDYEKSLISQNTEWMLELSYYDKRRIHNLKYFTWVEQRGKRVDELEEQWNNENYFKEKFNSYKICDDLIREFNERVGLINNYL
ncbi:MAG TPA: pyridoxal-phosphate dependent enzyme [Caldisericia bacterium]|nr:pyridoxal-phosphate dependent enzyme [Caldisericia bacterium]HPB33666.1 pyridoxal-phosphate dependent enzyme [Caldisericia bacterium]HQL66509.1 pyridoxal-phosphate dependent enzyme [Caldisericia bacterium]HQN48065.1 pyridoxal-phosphate dependent enzyme [Caldisericia bacterium]HQO99198.1 pyridoxal-phosphate dependent enzyme [Caldisericia bacterium]